MAILHLYKIVCFDFTITQKRFNNRERLSREGEKDKHIHILSHYLFEHFLSLATPHSPPITVAGCFQPVFLSLLLLYMFSILVFVSYAPSLHSTGPCLFTHMAILFLLILFYDKLFMHFVINCN